MVPSGRDEPDPVLLAVTGMSPAVLTETIWALAHESPPVLPSRVIVVTTSEGRRELERQLFEPDPVLGCPPWEALRKALAALGNDVSDRPRFGTTGTDIRVITAVAESTGRSVELPDLRHPADNAAAADFLLDQVRALVENPDCRLIASLAGGRKTMGALLYACLTLAGRETDRLTHVLVNSPFDALRGFWFPGQDSPPLTDREGKLHDPREARVELADVPFVPLRNLFQRDLGRKAGSFNRLVEDCREQVRRTTGEGLRLTVEQSRCELEVNGIRVRTAPLEHLVLLFLATRARRGDSALPAYKDGVKPLNEFRDQLRQNAPPRQLADWRHGGALRSKFEDDQEVRRAISSLGRKLRTAGGGAARLADCLPEKGRFSLAIPASLIHLA
ncbi:MAG: TIGR02584 family CRISPR-associated protein [Verrucomicrobiae bacterium]|nr:TIGR02584 family CRISPR-associated protein [Verrucomicrobiae bacterium]